MLCRCGSRRAGLHEQRVGVDAAVGRRRDGDRRAVELRARRRSSWSPLTATSWKAPHDGLLRVVGAQQAVAVELVVGGREVLQVEPHRDLDVGVAREAVVGLLEVGGLVGLADAGWLLARPRAARAGLVRRGPAQLGHPDRRVAVAVGGHDAVDGLVAEERVLADLAALAVEEVGAAVEARGVGVDADGVERALGAVVVEPVDPVVVVAGRRAGDDLRRRGRRP